MTTQDKRPGTEQIIEAIAECIRERKGHDITLVDLSDIDTSAASNFIICHGTSTTQVNAIADNVREGVQKHLGVKPYNYDGYQNAQWIVIDYGDTLVHVFLPEYRQRYNLEELWSDARIRPLGDDVPLPAPAE